MSTPPPEHAAPERAAPDRVARDPAERDPADRHGDPWHERTVRVGAIDLHLLEAGPADGPLVVLVHGWPELAYSWRHQIPVLAAAGYRVVAPDMRGYGGSGRPTAIEDYDIFHLTGDLVGLLDELGASTAAFVGHDWGAMVVWQLALMHPERMTGVAAMSVPFTPRAQQPPTDALRAIFGDSFFYILYFQEPGVAEAEFDTDPARTMRTILGGLTATSTTRAGGDGGFLDRLADPAELPAWITQDELDRYVDAFTRTGFVGGVNWYRNFDRNWQATEHLADAAIEIPCTFVGGTLDPVLALRSPDSQVPFLRDLRGMTLIDGAGHWVQQEAPGPVNDALLTFLRTLPDAPGGS